MVPSNREALFRVAQWTMTSKRKVGRKIRELVGTEVDCTIIMTELNRIDHHLRYARYLGVPATLTLVEWLHTLEYFHWLCAYCQVKPFEVLHHHLPQHVVGTTRINCIPACRHCCHKASRSIYTHITAYQTTVQQLYTEQSDTMQAAYTAAYIERMLLAHVS